MATASATTLDLEALNRLKSTEPPVWLAPNVELSETARTASQQLFSFLKTYTPKSPLDQLLTAGFDAEQIWQQIDLQSQPLISSLKREVKKFEKNPEEIGRIKKVLEDDKMVLEVERKVLEEESDGFDEELDDGFDDEEEKEDDEEEEDDKEEEEDEAEGGSESEGKTIEEEEKGRGGIEDEFLKINELQEYLEEDEAREYGLKKEGKKEGNNINKNKGEKKVLDDDDDDDDDEEEEEEEEEDEDEEDDGELGVFDDDDDEDANKLGNARYEDFFGTKKKKVPKRKSRSSDESEEDSGFDDEQEDDDEAVENQENNNLSTHEKQLKKLQSEIEKMEKANLDPKTWTMQGEVTAAQRPKNSALEVDLDFQHNVRPAPVITEEFTTSLEDMIKKRIIEAQFDDVQKVPSLPSKAPRESKELDENKSKKGLAEVYEEEYVQKTNPAAAPLSFSDEQKKEASMLFKKLCLKLDALSHFHFTPKPVIDDMSIQVNVPALAMEEIAPIAVSDAAMLAPEEVFAGKGDVKEEAELTQAERKRRRANKKRRYKAEAAKRMVKKAARENTLLNQSDGNEQ